MSVCAGGVRVIQQAKCRFRAPVAELPLFLCPGWIRVSRAQFHHLQPYTTSAQALQPTFTLSRLQQLMRLQPLESLLTKLPPQCSGCGALSQIVDKDEAGYYNLKRRSVTEYLQGGSALRKSEEDITVEKSLQAATNIDPEILKQLGFPDSRSQSGTTAHPRNMYHELTLMQNLQELLSLLSATDAIISSTMIRVCLYSILQSVQSRIPYSSLPTRSTMSTTLSTLQISQCPSSRDYTSFFI
jgi:hypothetical protein